MLSQGYCRCLPALLLFMPAVLMGLLCTRVGGAGVQNRTWDVLRLSSLSPLVAMSSC